MMEKIIKAIIKTIILIAIYLIIGVVLDFILNLLPYSAPVLLILAINIITRLKKLSQNQR